MEINFDKVAVEVRKLAEAKPDFVYRMPNPECPTACYNVWNGEGSCIVGQGMINTGVDPKWLENYYRNDTPGKIADDQGTDVIYKESVAWLVRAQKEQDRGEPWGEAVRLADLDTQATTS